MKRPTGITITAWLWIAMGGLMILSAMTGEIAYTAIGGRGSLPPAGEMPPGFAALNVVLRYFSTLLMIQSIVALTAICAGARLLRLKRWARTTLEVLSWLALFYVVGFGILWVYMWVGITGAAPSRGVPGDPTSFRLMGTVMGVLAMAAFAVPLVIMIRYLRGVEVRTAITNARQAKE